MPITGMAPLSVASSPLEDIPEHAPSILEVYHGQKPRTFDVSHPQIDRTLPPDTLPPVSEKLRKKLTDQSAFIDLADLLPANRELYQSVFTRKSGENDPRRKTISTYLRWSRAYYVFASHRSAYFPALWQPLWDYMDIISVMAERVPSFQQCVVYDTKFRMFASSRPSDSESGLPVINPLSKNPCPAYLSLIAWVLPVISPANHSASNAVTNSTSLATRPVPSASSHPASSPFAGAPPTAQRSVITSTTDTVVSPVAGTSTSVSTVTRQPIDVSIIPNLDPPSPLPTVEIPMAVKTPFNADMFE
ncbi:hypothetical protein BV898_17869 [Hypsibius exemplaris]|uniref:Uncharacterized protein n=1 Tax=Hypsibius exemplaris TaxID=2072580 RepID=A0A9X6NMZ7_HYPEX|nr:hypothetical protein BV898_17869 [Hypsibius exemplaris]